MLSNASVFKHNIVIQYRKNKRTRYLNISNHNSRKTQVHQYVYNPVRDTPHGALPDQINRNSFCMECEYDPNNNNRNMTVFKWTVFTVTFLNALYMLLCCFVCIQFRWVKMSIPVEVFFNMCHYFCSPFFYATIKGIQRDKLDANLLIT